MVIAGHQQPFRVLGIATANTDAARVFVDECAAVLPGLVYGIHRPYSDESRGEMNLPQVRRSPHGQAEQLDGCQSPEHVVREDAPLFVLLHRRPRTRHALHRSMCVEARSGGQQPAEPSDDEQRRGRTTQGSLAQQREKPERHADEGQDDGDVDDLRVQCGHVVPL
jgi:hypothetical protein